MEQNGINNLASSIWGVAADIAKSKVDTAQYDKSFNTVIWGINQLFTDDVPQSEQGKLIKEYKIPEISENYFYAFAINGNYYVKESSTKFKLYQNVVVRVPNGNWDKMYIESENQGTEYAAGKGIEIEGKEIRLKPAQTGDTDRFDNLLGGVWVNKLPSNGITIDWDGLLRLNKATSAHLGGIYIGDGLLSANGVCSVDIGKGMRFNDRDDREYPFNVSRGRSVSPNLGDGLKSDPSEDETEPDYGKIHLNLGNGLAFGDRIYEKKKDSEGNDTEEDDLTRYTSAVELKLGTGLRFGENGELIATATGGKEYKAGDNISISEDGTISAQVNEGLTIDQAIIIKEADAKYLLHNFTEIEYNAGNRIGYAGPGNQIIVQGYLVYPYHAFSEMAVVSGSILYFKETDDFFSRYSEISADFHTENGITSYKKAYLSQTSTSTNSATYTFFITQTNDSNATIRAGIANQNHWTGIGLVLEWLTIYPPGYTLNNIVFENGCARVRFWNIFKSSSTVLPEGYAYEMQRNNTVYVFPFASLAEYQAAVGLTYEPLTLTEVVDNPTVVINNDAAEKEL